MGGIALWKLRRRTYDATKLHSCRPTVSVVSHSSFSSSSSGVVEVARRRSLVDGEALADAGCSAVATSAAALWLDRHEVLQLLPGSRRRRRRRRVTETVRRSGQDGDWHDRAYNMTIIGEIHEPEYLFGHVTTFKWKTAGTFNGSLTTALCSMNGQIERAGQGMTALG